MEDSLVAADKKNKTERANPTEQASSGNSSKKKGPKPASLLKPMRNRADGSVICICNDLYAPALRPICQIAKLKHICKREGYKTNSIDWQPLLNILLEDLITDTGKIIEDNEDGEFSMEALFASV
ncbi:hypothetical protein HPP92_002638 [Vanilla planifolia]|uniref:Uncharacterized protein n=1 Tax=Vanilla planifolia TaxID=51239 RepID=A0A835VGG6_VANPL|nr:hypothetical protein HPP92_002638 [Vanilla planifolia]